MRVKPGARTRERFGYTAWRTRDSMIGKGVSKVLDTGDRSLDQLVPRRESYHHRSQAALRHSEYLSTELYTTDPTVGR